MAPGPWGIPWGILGGMAIIGGGIIPAEGRGTSTLIYMTCTVANLCPEVSLLGYRRYIYFVQIVRPTLYSQRTRSTMHNTSNDIMLIKFLFVQIANRHPKREK